MGCVGSSPSDDASAHSTKMKTLERTILSKYLSNEELDAFAQQFTIEGFGDGRSIFAQGDVADGFFIVADGAVNIDVLHNPNPAYKPRKAGQDDDDDKGDHKIIPQRLLVVSRQNISPNVVKTLLTTRKPGEFFGARLLTNESNNCSATAVGRTLCLKLTKPKWDAYIAQNNKLERRILTCLSIGLENALKSLQFLSGIDTAKLQLMASCFRFITVEKDAHLFKRDELGKEGNGLHYMLEGEVKVSVLEDGEEKTVAIVKKGQFFGEVGLVVHLPRTATVTARKKCLFLELTQSDFRNFVKLAPEVLEAFRDKLEDYNIPLRYLIHNPILQKFLKDFMAIEKSVENINFWLAAKNFRLNENKDQDDIRKDAERICEQFIGPDASSEVNVIESTKKEIMQALKPQSNVTRELFQKAEEEVLALMGRDTFSRFKRESPEFPKCLSEMTSTPNYKPSGADHKKTDAPNSSAAAAAPAPAPSAAPAAAEGAISGGIGRPKKKPVIDPNDPANQF
jgi:CRP-like cAMP-binding protein